jgi:hypothetical protein
MGSPGPSTDLWSAWTPRAARGRVGSAPGPGAGAGTRRGATLVGMADEWYWSLAERRAVHRSEKGPADHVLGPYPSKEAAEHWRERVDQRNEAWDDQDDAWEGDDEE